MNGFIDVHQHVLCGVDDGAKSFEEMAAMLRADVADGISTVIATPHVTPGVAPFDYGKAERALHLARQYCTQQHLDLNICAGAEILYTPGLKNAIQNNRLPTLDGTEYVLVEFIPRVTFDEVQDAIQCLKTGGYRLVIAHLERYSCLMQHVSRIRKLKEQFDVVYQVNCATILKRKGFWIDQGIKKMLKERLIDIVATDAHNITSRPCKMLETYEQLVKTVGKEYAQALTSGNAIQRFEL